MSTNRPELYDILEGWSSSKYAILGRAIRGQTWVRRIWAIHVGARAVFWGMSPFACYGTITRDKGVIRNYGAIHPDLDYVLTMDGISGWKVAGTSNAEGHLTLIKDRFPNETWDQGVAISGGGRDTRP